MSARAELAERRARLVAQCELERMRVRAAFHDAETALLPPADPLRRARLRPWVVRLVGIALPLVGFHRLGRMLRVAGTGLAVYRAISSWRSTDARAR